jgi:hypothetical protein
MDENFSSTHWMKKIKNKTRRMKTLDENFYIQIMDENLPLG